MECAEGLVVCLLDSGALKRGVSGYTLDERQGQLSSPILVHGAVPSDPQIGLALSSSPIA